MRLAAVVAAAAAVVNLLILGLLHVVSPEVDPATRPVSEYALGEFRWLATTRTLAEGVGAIALAVALLLERPVALRVERAAALLLAAGWSTENWPCRCFRSMQWERPQRARSRYT